MTDETSPGDERLEILAVEDSPTQAELLRHLLEQSGYRVALASTGAQALLLLGERAPSVVISDIIMPEMSGFELCRRIRADEHTRDIPVILLTSLTSSEDVMEGLACGADSFITKPYSKHYLITNIQQVLANRQPGKGELPRITVEVNIAGKTHSVAADRQRIITLLLSTYETAAHQNAELREAQEELRTVNERLEEKVRKRTAALEVDITNRKRTEQELRESEERFRLLVHQARDGIYVHELNEDRAGRFLEVNDSACRILGYSRSELLAMEVGGITAPDSLAQMPGIVSVLRARGSLVFVTENRTKDGRTIPLEVNARLFDLQGRTVVLAIARDITERKQAEERERQHLQDTVMLRDTALGFIQLAHDADVYQYVADRLSGVVGEAYGIVNSYDEAADQFTVRAVAGIGAQLEAVAKVTGRNPVGVAFTLARERRSEYASERLLKFEDGDRELSSGWLPGTLAQSIKKMFDVGGIYSMGFHWQGRVLGSVNIIMRRGAEIRDPAIVESFVNQVAIALQHRRDTDELIRHRAHLEELVHARTAALELANKDLEAFSYSVSHDLRAPLRAINGFAQALREDCAAQLDAAGHGYLDRMRAASRHMAELIDDLLDLSRVARLPLERKPVNLSELARTIAGELHEAEPARQVEFVIPDSMTAQADPVLAEMVLRNLLNNAWKFTGKHPTARIEVGQTVRDGEPVWFVRDDGAGFDMAYVGNLSKPFQRLHGPADFPGTGIGHVTVQRLVRRHGGRGWIEGAVEKGATFYFTFQEATREA